MADTDPEALERRIELTRAELARTVDAIADKVSPKRVVERSVAKVKTNAEQFVSQLGDFVGNSTHRAASNGAGPGAGDPPGESQSAPNIAPVLIGVGAVLMVGAAIALFRRRRRG